MSAFASRRRRQRLVLGGVLLAVGGIVAAAVAIGNTAPPELPPSGHPVTLENRPPRAKLSAADRREITTVARLFLRTAVSRHHPEKSWPISSPALRSGQTLADWKSGVLAVEPYPVAAAKWNLAYSDRGEVGLDVWVASDNLGAYPPQVFRLTFVARNTSTGRRSWLVDSWTPTSMPGTVSAGLSPDTPSAAADSPRASAKSSLLWVAAPFVALIAVLVGALGLSLRIRLRERRITAAFRSRSL